MQQICWGLLVVETQARCLQQTVSRSNGRRRRRGKEKEESRLFPHCCSSSSNQKDSGMRAQLPPRVVVATPIMWLLQKLVQDGGLSRGSDLEAQLRVNSSSSSSVNTFSHRCQHHSHHTNAKAAARGPYSSRSHGRRSGCSAGCWKWPWAERGGGWPGLRHVLPSIADHLSP